MFASPADDHEAHAIDADDQILIPAVHNRRILGFATARRTTDRLDADITMALQDGLGEAMHTAQACT